MMTDSGEFPASLHSSDLSPLEMSTGSTYHENALLATCPLKNVNDECGTGDTHMHGIHSTLSLKPELELENEGEQSLTFSMDSRYDLKSGDDNDDSDAESSEINKAQNLSENEEEEVSKPEHDSNDKADMGLDECLPGENVMMKCKICQDAFKQPMMLQCLHTFCKLCIVVNKKTKVKKSGKEETFFSCPICKSKTTFDAESDADDPKNVFIANHFYDRLSLGDSANKKEMCTICSLNHKSEFASHACFECKDFLCSDCAEKHKFSRFTISHEVTELDQDIFQKMKMLQDGPDEDENAMEDLFSTSKEKENFGSLIVGMKNRLKVFQKDIEDEDDYMQKLEKKKTKNMKAIQLKFSKAIEKLKQNEGEALSALDSEMDKMQEIHKHRKQSLTSLHQKIDQVLAISDNFFQNSSDDEFMSDRKWYRNSIVRFLNAPIRDPVRWNNPPTIQVDLGFLNNKKMFQIAPMSQKFHPFNDMKFQCSMADLIEEKMKKDLHTESTRQNQETHGSTYQKRTCDIDDDQASSKSGSIASDISCPKNKIPITQDAVENANASGPSDVGAKKKKQRRKKSKSATKDNGLPENGQLPNVQLSASKKQELLVKPKNPKQLVDKKSPKQGNQNLPQNRGNALIGHSVLGAKGGLLSAANMPGFSYQSGATTQSFGAVSMSGNHPMYTVDDVWQPPSGMQKPTTPSQRYILEPMYRLDVWIKSDINKPNITGLACIGKGKVAVSDYHNNKVKLFDSSGQFLQAYEAEHPTSLAFCAGKLVWCSGNTLHVMSMEKNVMDEAIQLGAKDVPHPLARGSVTELYVGHGKCIRLYEWIKKEKCWKLQSELVPRTEKGKKGVGKIMSVVKQGSKGFILSDWQQGAIYFVDPTGKISGSYSEQGKMVGQNFLPTGLHYDSDDDKLFVIDHHGHRLLMIDPNSGMVMQEWSTLPAIQSPLGVAGNKGGQLFLTGSDQFLHVYQYQKDTWMDI